MPACANIKSNRLVVVPLYNELSTIKKVITKVTQHTDADILIVDDGSTDGSHKIVENNPNLSLLRHGKNLGYGQTLISGFNYAIKHDYETVVTIDCDDQHEPQMIPTFFNDSSTCNILSGSRYLTEFPGDSIPPKERRSINMEITTLVNEITGFNLTDSFCGFKAYKVESLKLLELSEPGYGMPLQLWLQAWHHGLSVQEKGVARIYKDLERSFGDSLNIPNIRRTYYKKIMEDEMNKIKAIPLSTKKILSSFQSTERLTEKTINILKTC